MNELIQIFNFHTHEVRTAIHENGEPYFCLPDVLSILGLESRSTSKFNFDDKGVEKLATPTNGGVQEVTFISEPNLYRVIFRSNKEQAKQFQNWVFNEVLPTIRKTGSYKAEPKELTAKEKAECLSILMSTFGDVLSKEAKEIILITTSENLLGLDLGYRPQVKKIYSATEIGKQLGISADKVGRLANTHNLKTDDYGMWVLDKSASSDKQISNFRYYGNVIPILKAILKRNQKEAEVIFYDRTYRLHR